MAEHLSVETPVGALVVRAIGASGRPVALLWHSLFVDDRSWARVEPGFAADHRLVLITGPGHGQSSDRGRRYTLENCAAAALAVLDALEIHEPVDWVGNAWGGHVGVAFAATWPQRCRSLVAVGTPVHAYRLKDRVRAQALLALYRVIGPVPYQQNAVAEALLSARTREHDPQALELVRTSFAGADRPGMVNAIKKWFQ